MYYLFNDANMKKYLSCFFVIFTCCFSNMLWAQNPQWKCYTTAYRVNDIAFDGNFVWVGTEGGLVKLDRNEGGKIVYNQEREGFIYNNVYKITVDKQHNVWMVTEKGRSFFDGSTFLELPQAGMFYSSNCFDGDTTCWDIISFPFPYGYQFVKITPSTFLTPTPMLSGSPTNTHTLCADTNQTLWGTGYDGFWEFSNGVWKQDTTINIDPSRIRETRWNPKNGDLYLDCEIVPPQPIHQLRKYNNGNTTLIYSGGNNEVRMKCIDPDGNLWFTRDSMLSTPLLFKYDGTTVSQISTANFPIPYFSTFKVDDWGHWWIGMDRYIGGEIVTDYLYCLYEFDGTTWHGYNINHTDLPYNSHAAVAVTPQNEIVIGMEDYLAKGTAAGISVDYHFPPITGATNGAFTVSDIAFDHNHRMWVSAGLGLGLTSLAGLRMFDNGLWTNYVVPTAIESIYKITFDIQNRRWLGTSEGLYRHSMNWSQMGITPCGYLDQVAIDANNDIWVNDYVSDLRKYAPDGTTLVTFNDFNSIYEVNDEDGEIFIDHNNILWLCGVGHLLYYDGNNLAEIPYSFFGHKIWKMKQDINHTYWLVTEEGLIKWDGGNNQTFYPLPGGAFLPYDFCIDHAGNKWLSGWTGTFVFNENGIFSSPFANPYKPMQGKVYYDVNENGQKDSAEIGMNMQHIEIQPDDMLLYTNTNGEYTYYGLKDSAYTIHYQAANNWVLTSDSNSYHIFADTLAHLNKDFGCIPMVVFDSMSLDITSGQPRCGASVPFYLYYQNNGTLPLDGVVSFIPDSLFNFISAYPAPTSSLGDTLFFDFQGIQPFEQRMIVVNCQLPSPATISPWTAPAFHCKGHVSYEKNDGLILADIKHFNGTVLCSFDPNDKTCLPQGQHLGNQSLLSNPLQYMIRFQNTGNDFAYNVLVVDTLDADLDWNTFRVIGYSHPANISFDKRKGIAQFRFDNIMLPDSNHDEAGSHGWLSYEILPKKGLNDLAAIENTAYIYFDFNPAVVTNTTQTILVESFPSETPDTLYTLRAYPNPAQESVTIEWENPEKQLYQLRMVDMQGKIISTQNTIESSVTVSLKGFAKGIYAFVLRAENKVFSGKIMVK